MSKAYQICTRCVMDTSAVETVFHDDGTCNFCTRAIARVQRLRASVDERRRQWEQHVDEMKRNGKGRAYDCVIGVSGGIDSSWVACLTKEWGLRALAVHVDTGWNLELAVHNVKRMLETLGIDLETIVVDWEAFRRLQVAFLRSSTPDNDGPTDNMIVGGVYQAIRQHKIRYYLPGDNPYTENVLPNSWGTGMYDWKYMSSVNKRFDPKNRIGHLPHVSIPQYVMKQWLNVGLKVIRPLHYLEFDRAAVSKHLLETFDWKFYGAKHYESLFTKFDQGYILVRKFGFDKRRAHLSSLICSGMTTREQALAELEKPPYPLESLEEDIEYFCQKLNITRQDFDDIMALPPKTIHDYPNNWWFFDLRRKQWMKPMRKLVNAIFTPHRKAGEYLHMRKKICLLAFSFIAKDARVLRHLKFLGEHCDIIAIGYGDDPSPMLPGVTLRWHGLTPAWGSRRMRIARTLARWPGRIIPALDWLPDKMMADWRAARDIIGGADYDLFFGNDASALLAGVWQQERKGKPFIMDYHEYAPLEAEEKRWHRWFHGPQMQRLLKRYGRRAAGSATVNTMFAARFETEFGFPAITVMNAPELLPLPEQPARNDGHIRLAFHGNASGDRNLDTLLRAMPLLDERFVLHLMLTSGAEEGSLYRTLAAELAPGRVVFETPVAPAQTVGKLVAWDIGFNILEPLNYNHRHALPNKFFDYIHAGLATVCSNTVTAAAFVEEHGIGWLLPEITPHSLAALLNGLTPAEIETRKAAALRLRELIHARGEESKLVALVEQVLAAGTRRSGPKS